MLFIARFTDKPNMGELREKLFPAHLEWLDRNKDAVLVPGSIRPAVDEASVGGLWIIKGDSKAKVEELYKTDPFWANGLRQGAEVFYWKKAFEDRMVEI
jgi:uncharacterized protein YciI